MAFTQKEIDDIRRQTYFWMRGQFLLQNRGLVVMDVANGESLTVPFSNQAVTYNHSPIIDAGGYLILSGDLFLED